MAFGGERRDRRLAALHVAGHARRLAQQHVQAHVHCILAQQVVAHAQLFFGSGGAQHGKRAALTLAQRGKDRQIVRMNGQHITFLRFIAPDLHRRHAGFFQRHRAQVDHPATVRAMNQLGQGIGQTARANVVNRQNRVGFAQLPAAVDHFLTTAFDFRVAALHRVEVQVFGVGTGVHRRRCAATQANQQARAAQLNQQCAFRQFMLVDMVAVDIAQAAGNHDGLVVAAHLAVDFGFKGAEVAGQIGAAKFVVECCAANRAIQHDLQRRGNARRLAVGLAFFAVGFPRVGKVGNVQVGHGKAGQASLRARAATGGAFIADFAARTGGRTRKRRNGGWVVMGFYFHQDMGGFLMKLIAVFASCRVEALDRAPFDHRRVIRVGHQRAVRVRFVGVADHAKQGFVFWLAVDDKGGVEDLVAAVFRVGLGKHHQLNVGRIAADGGEVFYQVINFIRRQRQAQLAVGGVQRVAPTGQHVHRAQRLRRYMGEQPFGVVQAGQHLLGHPVMQQGAQLLAFGVAQRVFAAHPVGQTTLDAGDLVQAAMAGNVGGLGRPRRNRADARHGQKQLTCRGVSQGRLAVGEDARQRGRFRLARQGRYLGEMPVFRCHSHRWQTGLTDGTMQFVGTECRQRGAAAKLENGRH